MGQMARATRTSDIDLWADYRRAHTQLVTRLDTDLQARVGFPLAWHDVLVQLSEAPGRKLRLQDLADQMHFSRSGLTRLIDRIEGAGFVARQQDRQDRRGVYAVLTRAGRGAVTRAASTYTTDVDRYFLRVLSGSDKRALRTTLRQIVAASTPKAP